MIFHRNSNRNTSTKNQHAEGNCIKKRAKINDFSCEFKQNRTLMNFRRNSSRNWTTKNRHAEGNCIKKHTQIVFFCRNSFRNGTTKKSTRRRELHQKARRNRWFFVEIRAEIEARKIVTPVVIASPSPNFGLGSAQKLKKSMIFDDFSMKINDFWWFFDENWLEKFDTPVCKLKFSRQISEK